MQGSKFKKIPSRLLATIKEKVVAKCKNQVAREYKKQKVRLEPHKYYRKLNYFEFEIHRAANGDKLRPALH